MTVLHSISDIEKVLVGYIPAVKKVTGTNMTLERMFPLMEALGNPEKKLRIIHVAGTSGKTSTTYYVASLLMQAGKKVGLTVSPHVDSVAERVQINLEPIAEEVFAQSLGEFMDVVKTMKVAPTYFELLVAFVYWYFAKVGIDYAVIETGLGGLHDGTNVAQRPDKLCVITDIGYDHMQILGATLPEIAKQKAGIIHKGNRALMFRQSDEIMDVFKERATEVGANITILDQESVEVPGFNVLPHFQQRNWQLAYEAYLFLQKRDGLKILGPEELAGSMLVRIPGRMDEVSVEGKKVIMDGAHNGQKMEAFIGSFIKKYPGQKATILLGLKEDKQFSEVLPLLQPITHTLITTTFTVSQDVPSVGVNPELLGEEAEKLGFEKVLVKPDCNDAYVELMKQPDDIAIITGSFYLIGQLRHDHMELQYA